jgi:prepilin-type N-terminal cleavage/methylation domain-containing protein
MTSLKRADGFTLIDLLVTMVVIAIMAAMALPMLDSSSRGFRMKGDAQSMANMVSLAKMRASSRFSRVRIYVDMAARTYHLEVWNKDTSTWVPDGGTVRLSNGVSFGFAGLTSAPPNTQDVIGQSPGCTANNALNGATTDGTACIVFNSRGIPVDGDGAPLGGNALYITDGSGVYATTITATPLVRQWWSNVNAAAWVKQ